MDEKKDNNLEELQQKLQKLESEKNEYFSGWQRAKADYLNYKKEEAERLRDVARYTSEGFMRELVSILDSFDLGLRSLEKSGPVEKGVYMIRAQTEDVLKRHGLEKLDVSQGSKFDPALAEDIAEAESEKPPGTVIEVIEPGYRLHDKIIRPARVILSKGPSENDNDE